MLFFSGQGGYMSRETQKPSEPEREEIKSSRRQLLTGVLLGLGASILIQPNGGVAEAQDAAKDDEGKKKKGKKGGKKKKKDGDEPKKD
jgi:hypothetical protein